MFGSGVFLLAPSFPRPPHSPCRLDGRGAGSNPAALTKLTACPTRVLLRIERTSPAFLVHIKVHNERAQGLISAPFSAASTSGDSGFVAAGRSRGVRSQGLRGELDDRARLNAEALKRHGSSSPGAPRAGQSDWTAGHPTALSNSPPKARANLQLFIIASRGKACGCCSFPPTRPTPYLT